MKTETKITKKILPKELDEFRRALKDEINEIEKSGLSSTLLYSGRKILNKGIGFWYKFNVEYTPTLPADTPCKLIVGRDQFNVIVISFEEKSLIVSSTVPLPDTIAKAKLENGTTVLMERLIQCIENNADKKHRLWEKLFETSNDNNQHLSEGASINNNNKNQNKAINSAISNDITYIWGPPGTGKTTVIGQIIDKLYHKDLSVLIVSHTNTAVDGAINKIYKTYVENHKKEKEVAPILRYGNSNSPIPDEVELSYHIRIRSEDLLKQENELENKREENHKSINNIKTLLSKYNWIKNNELYSIYNDLFKIRDLKEDANRLDVKHNELNDLINTLISENPEHGMHKKLVDDIERNELELKEIEEKILEQSNSLLKLPNKIEEFRDETKKHDIYKEFKVQESKLLSQNHVTREISSLDTRSKKIDNELSTLRVKKEQMKKQINDYEHKSSLVKLFSSKKLYEENIKSFEIIKEKLSELEQEKNMINVLVNDYKKQLQNLAILKEKIKASKPSMFKEHWDNLIQKHMRELKSLPSELQGNKEKKSVLLLNLKEQNFEFEIIEKVFNEIQLQEKKLASTLKKLNDTNKEIESLEKKCTRKLDEECNSCMEFTDNNILGNNDERVAELKNIYEKLEPQVKKIDVKELKFEKDRFEQEQVTINAKLNDIEQKKAEIEKLVIQNSKIIGTTLTKSYLSDIIRERTFDAVILDEASMASIPALWCASYLAEEKVIIVGDFLQLPPIVMAETDMAKKWLGTDIFNHIGADNPEKIKSINNLVMLNEQYRMENDIADIANMYYGDYGGLITNDPIKDRVDEYQEFLKWYPCKKNEKDVRLIGTENLHAWVTGVPRGKRHSRLNSFSAAVTVEWAFYLLENELKNLNRKGEAIAKEPLILIIAPYRPHVDHVERLIDFGYKNRGFKENLGYINVGTIHSFQGREADIVIFDLVIDQPHWNANLFVPYEETNKDLRKMFNVAITRAKFKLFIIGNFEYCQKRAKNNALSELLNKVTREYNIEDAKVLLPDISYAPKNEFTLDKRIDSSHIICREDTFEDYFETDIRNFKEQLIIFSPFVTYKRLSGLLPYFVDAINVGKRIIVITKAISERRKREVEQYLNCEKQLKSVGVEVIHKKGMHEKLIFIDRIAIWNGSLNALSFTGNTGEIMHRYLDTELTKEYEKLFDIEFILNVSSKTEELKCPICGGELLVHESQNGGIYWRCINNDFSRNKKQQYPHDGELHCKTCNSTFVYSRKKEPRWICRNNPKHYQRLKESDLKLEKMANLIPNKMELKAIKKYFSDKQKEKTNKSEKSHDNKKARVKKKSVDNNIVDKNKNIQISIFDDKE